MPEVHATATHTVRDTLDLATPPRIAWLAWTDPTLLARWLAPDAATSERVGATFSFTQLGGRKRVARAAVAEPTRRLRLEAPSDPTAPIVMRELDLRFEHESRGVRLNLIRRLETRGAEGELELLHDRREWRFALLALRHLFATHAPHDAREALSTQVVALDERTAWARLQTPAWLKSGTIERLRAKDRFHVVLACGDEFSGDALHVEAGQFIGALQHPRGALWRLQTTTQGSSTLIACGVRAATSQLAAAGELESRWSAALARLA